CMGTGVAVPAKNCLWIEFFANGRASQENGVRADPAVGAKASPDRQRGLSGQLLFRFPFFRFPLGFLIGAWH
ncbi:MAG TPA: hypothetical protein DD670_05605, partial [Planctomycetaceae bacterium]|nr:hypothetical protein [Planctomycetaceae bacterium]